MLCRQLALVAIVALATGPTIARADDPAPPPPANPDDAGDAKIDPSAPPDHDRDLDHDDSTSRTPARPDDESRIPHDDAAYAPRLVGNAAKDIVVETPGERTPKNIAMLSTLGGAAVVAGIFGLYFHLAGKSAADDVSQTSFTGRTWVPHDQALADRSVRDRRYAIGLYSGGGALLIAAVVALIVTEPSSTTTIIHPHTASTTIAPIPSGAVLAHGWTF